MKNKFFDYFDIISKEVSNLEPIKEIVDPYIKIFWMKRKIIETLIDYSIEALNMIDENTFSNYEDIYGSFEYFSDIQNNIATENYIKEVKNFVKNIKGFLYNK